MGEVIKFSLKKNYTVILIIPPYEDIVFLSANKDSKNKKYVFSNSIDDINLVTRNEAELIKEEISEDIKIMNINKDNVSFFNMPIENVSIEIAQVVSE